MPATLSTPSVSVTLKTNMSNGTGRAKVDSAITDSTATSFVVGSAAGQVNKFFTADYTVNSSGATTIDLTTLTDPLNNSIALTKLRSLKITNSSATANEILTIGGGTNGIFAALTVTLGPKATLFLDFGTNELTVDSTHKILSIAAGAGTAVPVSITAAGR